MAAAAATLKRVTLELGGESAAIILADAELAATVPALIAGGFANNGEACVALTRVLAPASRYDEVAHALSAAISLLRVGDPSDPATVVGPLISANRRQRNFD